MSQREKPGKSFSPLSIPRPCVLTVGFLCLRHAGASRFVQTAAGGIPRARRRIGTRHSLKFPVPTLHLRYVFDHRQVKDSRCCFFLKTLLLLGSREGGPLRPGPVLSMTSMRGMPSLAWAFTILLVLQGRWNARDVSNSPHPARPWGLTPID